jgi:hypothetical protein
MKWRFLFEKMQQRGRGEQRTADQMPVISPSESQQRPAAEQTGPRIVAVERAP